MSGIYGDHSVLLVKKEDRTCQALSLIPELDGELTAERLLNILQYFDPRIEYIQVKYKEVAEDDSDSVGEEYSESIEQVPENEQR